MHGAGWTPGGFRSIESYERGRRGAEITRLIDLRGGGTAASSVLVPTSTLAKDDLHSEFDAAWLRSGVRPPHEGPRGTVRVVDLFSGCGALSLGISEACRALELSAEHVYAADINSMALAVCGANFPSSRLDSRPIETLVGQIGDRLSSDERKLRKAFGEIDILAGGPPCQGHSDLNNHTRRTDPRNSLFEAMIRFAQVLLPRSVIVENVPGVRHDKGGVTATGREALESLGYTVSESVLTASEFGAAQRRRRYVLVATRSPSFNFSHLPKVRSERTLRWACEDLAHQRSEAVIDSHAKSSKDNRARIAYLMEHGLYDLPNSLRPPCHRLKDHSYNSVYGRLKWDEPAPTITSGFNSPGQGRFVHPEAPRTLTPHEAARVQSIPDFFDWGTSNRESLTQMIGNAVPPKLAYAVALELLR